MLTNVAKHRVNTTTLWINAVCTQHAERRKKPYRRLSVRLVRFNFTKTNLLLTKVVVALDVVGVVIVGGGSLYARWRDLLRVT